MMIIPSPTLKEDIDDITALKRYNTSIIEATFINTTTGLELKNYTADPNNEGEFLLDIFSIEQNFTSSIVDNINVSILITPKNLVRLAESAVGLMLSLKLEYVDDRTGEVLLNEDPEVYQYKAYLYDAEDVIRRLPAHEVVPTEGKTITESQNNLMLPVRIQLLTSTSYAVNKTAFNGLLRDITIKKAIEYIATSVGITKIYMIPPDNDLTYASIIIPPKFALFNTALDFLQASYGIYSNGLNYYYTENILYVFPRFDMDLKHRPDLTIFKAPPSSYVGCTNYHKIPAKDELHIVTDTDVLQIDLGLAATENEGSSRTFLCTDRMIDGIVDHDIKRIHDVSAAVINQIDASIVKNSAIPRYRDPTNNVLQTASVMNEHNTEVLQLIWRSARLFLIKPSTPVKYVYDERDSIIERHGVVDSIKYELIGSGNSPNRKSFKNTCSMRIRLASMRVDK